MSAVKGKDVTMRPFPFVIQRFVSQARLCVPRSLVYADAVWERECVETLRSKGLQGLRGLWRGRSQRKEYLPL